MGILKMYNAALFTCQLRLVVFGNSKVTFIKPALELVIITHLCRKFWIVLWLWTVKGRWKLEIVWCFHLHSFGRCAVFFYAIHQDIYRIFVSNNVTHCVYFYGIKWDWRVLTIHYLGQQCSSFWWIFSPPKANNIPSLIKLTRFIS